MKGEMKLHHMTSKKNNSPLCLKYALVIKQRPPQLSQSCLLQMLNVSQECDLDLRVSAGCKLILQCVFIDYCSHLIIAFTYE